jgi:hypothetical protein
VGVPGEALVEALDVLVQQRVLGDVVLELRELVGVGQLAVDQQEGGLQEASALRELLDRVAAVAQDALVAVDVGDSGLAGFEMSKPALPTVALTTGYSYSLPW